MTTSIGSNTISACKTAGHLLPTAISVLLGLSTSTNYKHKIRQH